MSLVSVLIPTYNRARMIGDAIRSILGQTLSDFELAIYDDGSNDNTESVVNGFNDSRIKYQRCDVNRGVAHARNVLLNMATSEVCCWQDSDDFSNRERLQIQLDAMDSHQILTSGAKWVPTYSDIWREKPIRTCGDGSAYASAMFRKSAATRFDTRFSLGGEDAAWSAKFNQRWHINVVLYYIRRHRDRIGVWKRTNVNMPWVRRMREVIDRTRTDNG